MNKLILVLLATFIFTSSLWSQKENQFTKEIGIGVNYSWADRIDWADDSFYYYDLLPLVGHQFSTALRWHFRPPFSAAIRVAYQRSGFEGRHFSGVIPGSTLVFRKEIWSKYRIHHLGLSPELAAQINKKLRLKIGFEFLIKLGAKERRQKVFLSDEFGGDEFNAVTKENTSIFSSTSFGFSPGIVYFHNPSWGLGLEFYQGLSSIGNKIKNEFWFENRQIKLNVFTFL